MSIKPKKLSLECESCEVRYTLRYKKSLIPQCCPFCGEECLYKMHEPTFIKSLGDLVHDEDDFEELEEYDEE